MVANLGLSSGLLIPPFPPSLNTDSSLYRWLWVEGTPEIAELTISNEDVTLSDYQNQGELVVDGDTGNRLRFEGALPTDRGCRSYSWTGYLWRNHSDSAMG